jgi:2',3'-cyclic-nucleotide 2'-phosphodiesterase (5'-nucleotidase family)
MTRKRSILLLSLIVFFVVSCNNQSKEFTFEGGMVLLDTLNVAEIDSDMDQTIQQYRTTLEKDMNRVLAYSDMVLEKGTPEGTLNNFVADLVFEKGTELYKPADNINIDFCLLNNGGLRVPLPKGEITYSRVYELLPFENQMVVLTLSGEKTRELFEYLATSSVGMPVSGVKLTIKDSLPYSIVIQGESFDDNKNYKILTSDYLAGGGDNMSFFIDPIDYEYLDMKVRDAIIEHLLTKNKNGEKISAELDQRIKIIND